MANWQIHLLRAVHDQDCDRTDENQRNHVKAVGRELAPHETCQQTGIQPVGGEEDHGLTS